MASPSERAVRSRRRPVELSPALAAALRLGEAPEARPSSVPPQAWCYACHGLRAFRLPLPALQVRVIPLTITGRRVDEQRVTLREGTCQECGAPIYRVGGGRETET